MTVTVSHALTIDGVTQPTTSYGMAPADARHLGDHLIVHALQKINALAPDAPIAGGHNVGFGWTYDSGNGITATANFAWNGLVEGDVAAMQGVLDGAMAKLARHIASQGKTK